MRRKASLWMETGSQQLRPYPQRDHRILTDQIEFHCLQYKLLGLQIVNNEKNCIDNLGCGPLEQPVKDLAVSLLVAPTAYILGSEVLNEYRYPCTAF